MRTTIELSREAYYVAKHHVAERPAGNVVGATRRRWPSVHVDQVMTVDRAKQIRDDTE
jgi:hypothetical protein